MLFRFTIPLHFVIFAVERSKSKLSSRFSAMSTALVMIYCFWGDGTPDYSTFSELALLLLKWLKSLSLDRALVGLLDACIIASFLFYIIDSVSEDELLSKEEWLLERLVSFLKLDSLNVDF